MFTCLSMQIKTEVHIKSGSVIKTDKRIKTEVKIGEEVINKKNVDCLDLTVEGDFKLPSRKISGTIIIEDDD